MSIDISKLTKEQIIKMSKWRCPYKGHSAHTGLEHPVCYMKDTKGLFQEKVLYFDIEGEDLNADYGIMFNWYAIDEDGNHFEDYITLDDIKKYKSSNRDVEPREDTRIVKSLVELMSKYTRVIGHYSCLTPGHKVLTADLKYVNVEDLKIGDKLLAFEENSKGTSFRRFIESEVLRNEPSKEEVYEIKLSDGTVLESTGEHKWLVKSTHQHRWVSTEQLYNTLSSKIHNGGINFNRILPVWHTDTSYEAGWLAGFFDGEGTLYQGLRKEGGYGKYMFNITATQKEGIVEKQASSYLNKLNYKHAVIKRSKNEKDICSINISGGVPSLLKFLGSIRPSRLLKKFNINRLGALKTNMPIGIKIISIKPIGKKTVMVLTTSSQTYISEGFASHNCGYDLPFARTRAVIDRIDFPSYGMLFQSDTWVILKKKFKLSKNSLENGCRKLVGITHKDKLSLSIKHGCLRGEKWAIDDSRKHCKQDVIDLVALFGLTSKYMRRTKSSI